MPPTRAPKQSIQNWMKRQIYEGGIARQDLLSAHSQLKFVSPNSRSFLYAFRFMKIDDGDRRSHVLGTS